MIVKVQNCGCIVYKLSKHYILNINYKHYKNTYLILFSALDGRQNLNINSIFLLSPKLIKSPCFNITVFFSLGSFSQFKNVPVPVV